MTITNNGLIDCKSMIVGGFILASFLPLCLHNFSPSSPFLQEQYETPKIKSFIYGTLHIYVFFKKLLRVINKNTLYLYFLSSVDIKN